MAARIEDRKRHSEGKGTRHTILHVLLVYKIPKAGLAESAQRSPRSLKGSHGSGCEAIEWRGAALKEDTSDVDADDGELDELLCCCGQIGGTRVGTRATTSSHNTRTTLRAESG